MTKNARDAVVVAYGRAPLAKANKGSFAKTHPIEYGAQTLKGVLDRLPGFDPALIDDVIVGCSMPERFTGFNIARLLILRAGLPDSVPGQTLTRFCSSGLQSIATASNAIKAGEMDVVVAGGIELMTGLFMGHPEEFHDSELLNVEPAAYIPMGITAENVAEKYGIHRDEMEAMAVASHQKAAAAQAAGKFDEEIIPIQVETENGLVTVTRDEGIRPRLCQKTTVRAPPIPCFLPQAKISGIAAGATPLRAKK